MSNLEPTREEWRAVPLEVLRGFVAEQAERTSMRAIADEMGVGRSTLHSFVESATTPHPRVRRLIALWYLTWGMEPEPVDVDQAACGVLLADLPDSRRERAAEELTMFVRDLHRRFRGRRFR